MDLLTANGAPGDYPPSWYAATAEPLPPFPALAGEVAADVCVVGGGYTGLSAALHLAEAGMDVVVLDAQRLGWGASGRNGGQLHSGQRRDQDWLEKAAGRTAARALWDMAEEAKALVRGLVSRHAIVCDLRAGIIEASHKPGIVAAHHAYAEKLARDYGYDQIVPLDRRGIAAAVGSSAYFGGSIDRGAGHLHPLALALGLARAATGAGARAFERSRALSAASGSVRTDAGRVRARFVILACNGYIGALAPEVARRVMPLNNFIVATAPLDPGAADAMIPGGEAVADSRFVVNYFRMTRDRRLLFGGGESTGSRFPPDIAALVRPRLAQVYPRLADVPIDYAWGGTLAITRSRMPAFQRLGPDVFSVAGYSGHGVAKAVLAGRLMAEAVQGTAARFDVFARLTPPPFPGGTMLRAPLLGLAMRWYGLRDRL